MQTHKHDLRYFDFLTGQKVQAKKSFARDFAVASSNLSYESASTGVSDRSDLESSFTTEYVNTYPYQECLRYLSI